MFICIVVFGEMYGLELLDIIYLLGKEKLV